MIVFRNPLSFRADRLENALEKLHDTVRDYRHTLAKYGEATVETDEAYIDMATAQEFANQTLIGK